MVLMKADPMCPCGYVNQISESQKECYLSKLYNTPMVSALDFDKCTKNRVSYSARIVKERETSVMMDWTVTGTVVRCWWKVLKTFKR